MNKKNVVIIGASSSIGKEIIDCFSDTEKYSVVVTYNNNAITKSNFDYIKKVKLDILSREERGQFTKTIFDIDIIIILSGLLIGHSLDAYDEDDIDKTMNVNAISHFKLIKSLLPKLRDDARIIIMSSIAGEKGSFDPIYAAAKGSLIPFAKSLATWLGNKIKVNVIAPGLIEDSSMFHEMSDKRRKYHRERSPTGLLTTKTDLAKIIFDLVQPHWRNVNGEVISVNGGV